MSKDFKIENKPIYENKELLDNFSCIRALKRRDAIYIKTRDNKEYLGFFYGIINTFFNKKEIIMGNMKNGVLELTENIKIDKIISIHKINLKGEDDDGEGLHN